MLNTLVAVLTFVVGVFASPPVTHGVPTNAYGDGSSEDVVSLTKQSARLINSVRKMEGGIFNHHDMVEAPRSAPKALKRRRRTEDKDKEVKTKDKNENNDEIDDDDEITVSTPPSVAAASSLRTEAITHAPSIVTTASPSLTPSVKSEVPSAFLSSSPSATTVPPTKSTSSAPTSILLSAPTTAPSELLSTGTPSLQATAVRALRTFKIPSFSVYMLVDSVDIDERVMLNVTTAHMNHVFENAASNDHRFVDLDLSITENDNFRRRRSLQAKNAVFYMRGEARFSPDSKIDESMVEMITVSSFVGGNLETYIDALNGSGLNVTNLFASLTDNVSSSDDTDDSETNSTNVVQIQSDIEKEPQNSSRSETLIASASFIGVAISFFSVWSMYRSRRLRQKKKKFSYKNHAYAKQRKREREQEIYESNAKFPVRIQYGKEGKANLVSSDDHFHGFGIDLCPEIDDISAISFDSGTVSNVTDTAWGTSTLPLGSDALDESEAEIEKVDRSLQPDDAPQDLEKGRRGRNLRPEDEHNLCSI